MTTHFSKFLFPIYFANLFIYICFNILGTNFHIYDSITFFQFIAYFHINVILPIYMILELYLIEHTRAPSYIKDFIYLAIIFIIRWGYAMLFKLVLKNNYYLSYSVIELGNVLLGILISVNGYLLYDFILFKRHNPQGNYSVMIEN